ncbi:hypothetical protein PAMP_022549 [Pampus punctatissimus]
MLACLQRRQNPPPQHPVCASKTLEPPQALGRKYGDMKGRDGSGARASHRVVP